MKHRSIIAFILLAAALVAAPQVSHDLATLRSALGARIRGEILHAFLSLHVRDAAGEVTPRPAATQLASCKVVSKPDEPTASHAKQNDSRAHAAPRVEAAPQKETYTQLAMLIPPGSSTDIPAPSGTPGDGAHEERAIIEQRGSAELPWRMASLAAHFKTTPASKSEGEEVLRNLGPLLRDTVWVRAAENGTRVRVLKVRRPARAGCANPSASTPHPATVESRPALPAAFQMSAGE